MAAVPILFVRSHRRLRRGRVYGQRAGPVKADLLRQSRDHGRRRIARQGGIPEQGQHHVKDRQELVNHRFELLRAEAGPDANPRRLLADAAQSTLLPGIQFVFDDLRLIAAPAGDERQVEEMVGAFQFAVETGQSGQVTSARQFAELFHDFNRFARAYGLDQCAIEKSHYEPVWAVSRAASRQKG